MKPTRISFWFVFFVFFWSSVNVFAGDNCLFLHFIDVGEGEAVFIKTPKGETILIDSGNFISGYKVAQYLKTQQVKVLDHFILTHPHLDHIGGAFFIKQDFKVGRIYDNGQDLSQVIAGQDVYRWYCDLVRQDAVYSILKAGDSLTLDGVSLSVLWPEVPVFSSDFNANSLVIMVEAGQFRCLLTADINKDVETQLLPRDLKADILKIAHHGAADATSREFLAKVSPRIAVISINDNNIRGYPSRDVLKRIEQNGDIVFRIDLKKNIFDKVDKK